MLESTDTLWRYMKLSTFLLLLEGKAWFPSVASLRAGDPLEAALGKDLYAELWSAIDDKGEIERVSAWLDASLPDFMHRMLDRNSENSMLHSQVHGEEYADRVAAVMAAWCWFKSDLESGAMWSVYGHQGVAVRTDRDRLGEALPPEKKFSINDMTYVDRRPCAMRNIDRIIQQRPDLILRPYFLKAIEYKHEQEVRVAAYCPEGAKGLMVTGIKPELLIREVIISPLLPSAEAEAIERVVTQRMNNASLSVTRSSLAAEAAGEFLAKSITESLYGETDDNIDISKLPPWL
jgi:hypothetical protein